MPLPRRQEEHGVLLQQLRRCLQQVQEPLCLLAVLEPTPALQFRTE